MNQQEFIDQLPIDFIVESLKPKLTDGELIMLIETDITFEDIKIIKKYGYFQGISSSNRDIFGDPWYFYLFDNRVEFEKHRLYSTATVDGKMDKIFNNKKRVTCWDLIGKYFIKSNIFICNNGEMIKF